MHCTILIYNVHSDWLQNCFMRLCKLGCNVTSWILVLLTCCKHSREFGRIHIVQFYNFEFFYTPSHVFISLCKHACHFLLNAVYSGIPIFPTFRLRVVSKLFWRWRLWGGQNTHACVREISRRRNAKGAIAKIRDYSQSIQPLIFRTSPFFEPWHIFLGFASVKHRNFPPNFWNL